MKPAVAANLFRGAEAVGGKLHFNDNDLLFCAHALNIQTGDTVIPYAAIADVKKVNTLGVVPNGMLVVTRDHVAFQFVLWNRNEIIAFIRDKAGLGPLI